MPYVTKKIIDQMSAGATTALARVGFKRRKDAIYTLALDADILGWIGLNRTTARGDGRLGVAPVIGVRHQDVERRVAEACGTKFHAHSPPTLSSPIGYLMPAHTYKVWLFDDDDTFDATMAEMVTTIETFGVPFIHSHTTLTALVDGMMSGFGVPPVVAYRLPVLLRMLGRRAEADRFIESQWSKLGEPDNPAHVYFRRFVEKLQP